MRYDVMRQLTTIQEGIEIYDLFSVNWRSDRLVENADVLRTTKKESIKAYAIADAVYGIPEYLDLLMFVNNIADPLVLRPNQELYIPKEDAVKQFILKQLQTS